jgi:hypothetical protein
MRVTAELPAAISAKVPEMLTSPEVEAALDEPEELQAAIQMETMRQTNAESERFMRILLRSAREFPCNRFLCSRKLLAR